MFKWDRIILTEAGLIRPAWTAVHHWCPGRQLSAAPACHRPVGTLSSSAQRLALPQSSPQPCQASPCVAPALCQTLLVPAAAGFKASVGVWSATCPLPALPT